VATGPTKKFEDIFSYLDTIQERDRQTDGHQTTAKTALTHSVVHEKVGKWTKMSEGKLVLSCATAVADFQQNIKCHFVT